MKIDRSKVPKSGRELITGRKKDDCNKLRDLATALMDQYPDDSDEWFVRRFAARCQSDPELEREAVEQYGIVLRHLLQTAKATKATA